jgi:ATP adenylyltransferase
MPEQLWAPWRLQYVSSAGQSSTKGLFLRLPESGDDRASYILHRGALAFAVLNAYPYTSGHTMVVPYRQCASLTDLAPDELAETAGLVADVVRWIDVAFQPDGYNVGLNQGSAAGAGIPDHLHWHVVPRWHGDTNFMTTVGDARVIPASLDEAFDRILAAQRAGR